jgi:hypothetical protein
MKSRLEFVHVCLFAILIFASWIIAGSTAVVADDGQIPDDITVLYNLRYREGSSKDWVLDLAMQKDYRGKPRPAIVVIHGGGWLEGDKSSFSTPDNRPPGNIIEFAKLDSPRRRSIISSQKKRPSRRHCTIANAPFAGCGRMPRSFRSTQTRSARGGTPRVATWP